MTVDGVRKILEEKAPRQIAWERDNTGLQSGDPGARVRGILVALDPTEAVVAEAVRRKRNLIVTHHPLLFRPLTSVTPRSAAGRCLTALLAHDVALLAAHTNLDFASGGTSFALAEAIGLADVRFLRSAMQVQKKIVTFVPPAAVENVCDAMADAGAGVIGNYDHCFFRTEGTGTFRGNASATPAVGRAGRHERVHEIKIETVVPAWKVPQVIDALRRAHPYEEPAFDILPTDNISTEYGQGVVGTLPRPVGLRLFLRAVKRSLGTGALRYAGDERAVIRRVALCGGSGADLTDDAVAAGADVFVTADITYHAFHAAAGKIALVDAGHFETEFPVVRSLVRMIGAGLRRRDGTIPVHQATTSTNPVLYA
jgi:dinuclear metal center YbgI/SA1388 family protein